MRREMPSGLRYVRTTPQFTHESTPDGLRRAHRVATGVWGRLKVSGGRVDFVFEDEGDISISVTAGEYIDIPPDTAHHVVTHPGCQFVVEFYAP